MRINEYKMTFCKEYSVEKVYNDYMLLQVSLVDTDNGYVWCACFDRKIYVISMETKCSFQMLRHHTASVTCLCSGSDSR